MTVMVRLIGLKPDIVPSIPEDGWYKIEVNNCAKIEEVLSAFGLKDSEIAVLKNGNHADRQDTVQDGDNMLFMHLVMGG